LSLVAVRRLIADEKSMIATVRFLAEADIAITLRFGNSRLRRASKIGRTETVARIGP
jgi:hypothetical protein